MGKDAIDAAIAALETWGRTVDNWVLIFGAGVAICLMVEIIFSVAHWRNENKLRPLRAEQARLHAVELAQLGAVADEAKARALEAQVVLEKFKAPRRLTTEQKSSLTERMKPFSGTAFAMSAVGAESTDFATDIAESLMQAGWRWINWPLGGIATRPPGRPELGLDMLRGVETHIFYASLQPLAIELFQALTAAGFKNQWILLSAPRAEVTKTAIILIGSKE